MSQESSSDPAANGAPPPGAGLLRDPDKPLDLFAASIADIRDCPRVASFNEKSLCDRMRASGEENGF